MNRASLRVVVGVVSASACFHDPTGATAGDGSATTSAASTTGAGPSSTASSGAGTSGDLTTGPSSSTTSSATTSPTSSTASTSSTSSTSSTTGPLCPAAAGLGDTPECDACIAEACCEPAGACVGAPACASAWPCTLDAACIAAWGECPGFAEAEELHTALLTCVHEACLDACRITPCDEILAACYAIPECLAIDACVAAQCNEPCPESDPFCFFACWDACKEGNAPGVDTWDMLSQCVFAAC